MADDRVSEQIITQFFLDTCQFRRRVNNNDVNSSLICVKIEQIHNFSTLTTGSVAEFYIDPMLSCVGDTDIMAHGKDELAIPAGYAVPTQLPDEFRGHVFVREIISSEYPGYVYLVSSHILTERADDDGKYSSVQCERVVLVHDFADDSSHHCHGPADLLEFPACRSIISAPSRSVLDLRVAQSARSMDVVRCVRCLIWPPQAADWPTRYRSCGWPDRETVDYVVSRGCDTVRVAHPLCRQDEWMGKRQWRLSFSRAEIVLLNRWSRAQQIVYHMLRKIMKTEQLTDSANSEAAKLSNYHIKTLMLWACELKSESWWTDDLNLVRICVRLLHTLAVWLSGARCRHYFISNCNLFDRFQNARYVQVTANRLMSVTRTWLCKWCVDRYLYGCAQFCPGDISDLLWGPTLIPHDGSHRTGDLQKAVSAIVEWRKLKSPVWNAIQISMAQFKIMASVSGSSLTVPVCVCWMDQLAKTDRVLCIFFVAVVFLHVAYKTTQHEMLADEMLDVLAVTCLHTNDARRCLSARYSSMLSLSQATMLTKVVANKTRTSALKLIETELSKAYFYRALRCTDSDSDAIYCLANVYLAVLYHTSGHYMTAIDHCTMVTRSNDHSMCGLHVVQGEILPRIDDQVDNILGLAVFYQYLQAAALNRRYHEGRHVSVFTVELFAHYLQFLSVTKCRQITQTAEEIRPYQSCLCKVTELFVTDVMLFICASCRPTQTQCPSDERGTMNDDVETTSSITRHLDTSRLVALLQKCGVEHLTLSRELEARHLGSSVKLVTTDFEALYAYKCGQYRRCLQLSRDAVESLLTVVVHHGDTFPGVFVLICPELIQLMDDDIVSLIGLMVLMSPVYRDSKYDEISQLVLSMYLMTQSEIKLRRSFTSLAPTLKFASSLVRQYSEFTADHVVLEFVKRKILTYS